MAIHGLQTLLFDRHGLASFLSTLKFIQKIKGLSPQLIHLHNVHGYYLHYPTLFNFLRRSKIKIIWTLHDCWPFTGHCAHYENIACEKWKSECNSCPKRNKYPKSLWFDNSKSNFRAKKNSFSKLSNLLIVTPSNWLRNELTFSLLSEYKTIVINNGVDINLFSEKQADVEALREKLGLKEKKVILSVAFNWSSVKGLSDIFEMAKCMPECFVFIIVGLDTKQIMELPHNIIGVEKTGNQKELANYYGMADVFFNPTYMDTFPTTNLEALACGTPIVTYRAGGSPESIGENCGIVVEKGDITAAISAVELIASNGKQFYRASCRKRAVDCFDKEKQFKIYTKLYDEFLNA